MRRPIALAAALLLAVIVAAPVQAATVKRAFGASVGTGGASGTARVTVNTDATGRVDYALKSMHKGWTYRVEVRKGRCANLGAVVARPSPVKASSTGKVTLSRRMSITTTHKILSANWSHKLAIRFVSGSSIRCGNLNFVHATRVSVPSYGINMPVVRSPNGYPYCNVAMYMGALSQPAEPGVTFIFAHARKGMFLPLLSASKVNNGAAMIGRTVNVYTSNSRINVYRITKVRRHVKSIQSAVGVSSERLWLQTSEGPNFSYPKLVIVAERVGTDVTSYAASHPKPHRVKCG